jgi:hypothetical protein
MRLGSIAPAQRGDWRKEVLQWVGDHDGGADWRLGEDELVEVRNLVRALPAVSAVLESRARRSFLATKLAFLSLSHLRYRPSRTYRLQSHANFSPSQASHILKLLTHTSRVYICRLPTFSPSTSRAHFSRRRLTVLTFPHLPCYQAPHIVVTF